jgi:hypothetical protein
MQDADLSVQLAGIAGVFVGFGALISVRSGGASGAHEVAYIGVPSRAGLCTATSSHGLTPLLPARWHRAAASFASEGERAKTDPATTCGSEPQVAMQRSCRWYACRDASS